MYWFLLNQCEFGCDSVTQSITQGVTASEGRTDTSTFQYSIGTSISQSLEFKKLSDANVTQLNQWMERISYSFSVKSFLF